VNRGTRLALVGGLVVVAVVAFLALRPKPQPAPTGATSPSHTGATPTGPAAGRIPVIRVVHAKPASGIRKISVRKGETIRFRVVSDVADEIHVHGYDLKKDVPAGGSVSFAFPARFEGGFEVELESRGEQIAQLEVTP
jgi:hypothetical protein